MAATAEDKDSTSENVSEPRSRGRRKGTLNKAKEEPTTNASATSDGEATEEDDESAKRSRRARGKFTSYLSVGDHPKYSAMINEALEMLADRNGSSRQAIVKFIYESFDVGRDLKVINRNVKLSIRSGLKTGILQQATGKGATGSFMLGANHKTAPIAKSRSRSQRMPTPDQDYDKGQGAAAKKDVKKVNPKTKVKKKGKRKR